MANLMNYSEGNFNDGNYKIEDEDTATPANLNSISSYAIDLPVGTLVRRIQKNIFMFLSSRENSCGQKIPHRGLLNLYC